VAGDQVLIDTVALLALINADDELHLRAADVYRSLSIARCSLVTTEWVLAEFLNGASSRQLRVNALSLHAALRASPRVTILEASHHSWERGLALYTSRSDKEWSFVDCVSMDECIRLSIRRVLTRDHHFRQAGFEILL
jgi:predicted nucleic acid-binding protein